MVTDVAASSKSAAAVHREHHSNGLQSAGRVRPGRSQLITVRRSMDVPGITESTHAGGFARMGSGTLLDLTEAPSPARLPADPRPRLPAEGDGLAQQRPDLVRRVPAAEPGEHDNPQVVLLPTRVLQSRSEEHTSELQSRRELVCRLLLEK